MENDEMIVSASVVNSEEVEIYIGGYFLASVMKNDISEEAFQQLPEATKKSLAMLEKCVSRSQEKRVMSQLGIRKALGGK